MCGGLSACWGRALQWLVGAAVVSSIRTLGTDERPSAGQSEGGVMQDAFRRELVMGEAAG